MLTRETMYAVVILLLHFISFIKHSDDPLQDFTHGYRTYREKELLNFQMYCLMGCDTIYPGGSTPFHNELWLQTNLLPPISLFMSSCFDGKICKKSSVRKYSSPHKELKYSSPPVFSLGNDKQAKHSVNFQTILSSGQAYTIRQYYLLGKMDPLTR
jgi:hypothetical protein